MKKKPLREWLLSPWVILPSMILGILIGLYDKELAAAVAPFGELYLKLLQMCVLPLIITAIVTSLGNMLQAGTAKTYIKKLIFIFSLGLIITTSAGLVTALVFSPGSHLSPQAKEVLSNQIATHETNNLNQSPPTASEEVFKFVEKIVPSNIFSALSNGENLAILFFCVLVGIAIGSVSKSLAATTLIVFDAIYLAFLKIITWVMYGLPLGLCFLFAGYIAEMGLGILFALSKLIVLILVLALLTFIAYSIIIWKKTGRSFLEIFRAFKTPLLIAFSTSSSFAALPTLLVSLQKNLGLNKDITDLSVPLGTTLNQQGTALHFAAMAIFVTQLYSHPLSYGELLLTVFTCIFASIATSGIPVIAAISIFAMVLDPINLPSTIGIILLAAIEPIVDPFLTALSVTANAAAAVLVAIPEPVISPVNESRA